MKEKHRKIKIVKLEDTVKLQALLATMNQKDYSKLRDVNIQSSAVVVNQCDTSSVERFEYSGKEIIWINTTERGLSRSRNMALEYATADICLLVDDDEHLRDGYEKIIESAFEGCPYADLITFNIHSIDNKRKRFENKKNRQLRFYNIMRYGSARIAFKKKSIDKNSIRMNVDFGAGSIVSNGEDSIFLVDCLKAKMKAYSWPETIADIDDNDSTWFAGYTEKFFLDKGMVFAAISSHLGGVLCLQYVIRHKEFTKSIGFSRAFKKMLEGCKIVKSGELK